MKKLINYMRLVWMPGTDIFTRARVDLERYWKTGPRRVLDAGFGNGWFSYRAFRSGATVVSVAFSSELVEKAKSFYNGFLGVGEERLQFKQLNLYEAMTLDMVYDEIICYETLEHIKGDRGVCVSFYQLLKPGGVLHLCCPNSEHPRWRREILDETESGGHVRHGYTVDDYRKLLEPIGFRIDAVAGVGGAAAVFMQEIVQENVRRVFGEAGAMLVALLSIPIIKLERSRPGASFSIYVRAIKPAG